MDTQRNFLKQERSMVCVKYSSRWELDKFNKSWLFQRLFCNALGYSLMLSIIYNFLEKHFRIRFSYWRCIYFRSNLCRILEKDTHLINMLTLRDRSCSPGEFFEKGVLQICNKFTGAHPCRSKVSIKLNWKFSWYLQNTFALGDCFWKKATWLIT